MIFPKNRLPERIKMIRGNENQTDFASVFGVRQQVLSSWEKGKAQPSIENIIAMCMVSGVSADWLLGLSDVRSGAPTTAVSSGNSVSAINSSVGGSNAAAAAEISRLLALVESQQKVIARLAGVGKGEG